MRQRATRCCPASLCRNPSRPGGGKARKGGRHPPAREIREEEHGAEIREGQDAAAGGAAGRFGNPFSRRPLRTRNRRTLTESFASGVVLDRAGKLRSAVGHSAVM